MRKISLDNLRLVFVICVVIAHFSQVFSLSHDIFYDVAIIAVKYFFLLSGFGLTVNNKYNYVYDLNETINFAFHRIKKVYYCYLVIILVTIPIRFIAIFEKYDFNKAILSLFATIILTPFMLQSTFGLQQLSHLGVPTFWFISSLFILYLLYPTISRFIDRIENKLKHKYQLYLLLFFTYSVSIVIFYFFRLIESNTIFNDLSYTSPYINIFPFIEGMIIGKIMLRNQFSPKNTSFEEISVTLLFIIWIIICNVFNSIIPYDIKMIMNNLIALLIILIFSFEKGLISKLLSSSNYGKYAMWLYLLHFSVLLYLNRFVHSVFISSVFFIIIMFVCCFCIDKIQYYRNRK